MNAINRAEQELERYRASSAEEMTAKCLLFMYEQCRWQPNGPHQIFWIDSELRLNNVLVVSTPRAGKDMSTEAVDLYEMAMNPQEDLRIYAPKLDQCKEILSYHYNWIDKSQLLRAFLRRRNGKPIFSTETYEFANLSNAKLYSIKGEIEGHNVSIARIIEFDDWDWEIFGNAVMRRMGAKAKNERAKRIRVSGTIQGEENIFRMTHDEGLKKMFTDLSVHPSLGVIDVHLLLSFGGVLDEEAVAIQQELMTDDEWARSMLLQYTEARNFIWQKYLRAGMKKSMQWGLEAVPFFWGGRLAGQPGSTIGVGLDCGHGGSGDDSSVYSLQFYEEIRVRGKRYTRWINGANWPGYIDPSRLETEICAWISYYRPAGGFGDALGMNLIAAINRRLYREGVTEINIDDFPDNKPADWSKWYLIPMWNTDAAKHEMYTLLQLGVHQGYLFYPYYDDKDDTPEAKMCHKLMRQVKGIRQTATKGNYPSYAAESKKIGDDDTDASGMCVRWLNMHSGGTVDWGLVKAIKQGRVFNAGSMLGRLKEMIGG